MSSLSISASILPSPSSKALNPRPATLLPSSACSFKPSSAPSVRPLFVAAAAASASSPSFSADLRLGSGLPLSLSSPSPFSFSSSVFNSAPPQTHSTAMRGAEADVMGLLLKERIVFLGCNIDDFVADAIISQLILLDAQDPTKDIRLFINSPGGSLSATMAIYDVMQLVRADVSTIALGIAASTSSIILGGGTKGKRLAMPNTRIMMHQPLGGASGQAIDVEIQAREIMHNKKNVTRIIAGFTGRSFEQVEKDIDRDRYMSPIEAVEYGLIDGVIDKDAIIPLEPVPERVRSKLDYEEIMKDPQKFLRPDIPDDEIY